MNHFLILIKCRSPYLTPWRSCTIWGRICWLIKSGVIDGWTIDRWMQESMSDSPPLIVSDGLPVHGLPTPAAFLACAGVDQDIPKTVHWDYYQDLCMTGDPSVLPDKQPSDIRVSRQHVMMDRATGSTIDGQLRTERGVLAPEGIMIIVQSDSLDRNKLLTIFKALCREGWGYGRNYGYGQLALEFVSDYSRPRSTGSVVTLGHCHPTEDLPKNGFWRFTGVPVLAHHPEARRPKMVHDSDKDTAKPEWLFASMLAPGATFQTDAQHLGKVISSQIDGNDNHLHNGLVPTLPVKVEDSVYG